MGLYALRRPLIAFSPTNSVPIASQDVYTRIAENFRCISNKSFA